MHRVTGYKTYYTREGDTFDALALNEYNNEKLAHVIMQFNPDYCDVLVFNAHVKLRIPVVENTDKPGTLPPWRQTDG